MTHSTGLNVLLQRFVAETVVSLTAFSHAARISQMRMVSSPKMISPLDVRINPHQGRWDAWWNYVGDEVLITDQECKNLRLGFLTVGGLPQLLGSRGAV